MDILSSYVAELDRLLKAGIATEHSYRPALQNYLTALYPKNIKVTNEPKRQDCGAPDYLLSNNEINIGFIEAKIIGTDLIKIAKSEQLHRYRKGLDNLILTDHITFIFFLNGEQVNTVTIAKIEGNRVIGIPENYKSLETALSDFIAFQGQTIKSAKKLAEMMARKAETMKKVFLSVVKDKEDSSLKDQLKAFQSVLMHDMDEEQFADVYAQTIAYGLFTARLHDESLEDFSRSEALLLIPKSNPFLRQLFSYVAGPELDDRVIWIVDALCDVYRAADLKAILKDFGTATGQKDPMLHFYETFLGEYDKSLKKARGVWYTPEPVVQFIVRAIDDVLKEHFGLKDGIADTSKIKVQVAAQEADGRTKTGRKMYETEVHKVQLLDVATGTGTFLAEAVKQVYRRFEGQQGVWSSYVDQHLLPRLHGFELLMASYAMCHMKLDLLLRETGYKPTGASQRLSVFLTNSLEEHHKDSHLPFANWLSKEANEASRIKRDMPIMVAFGNPPYSGESSNKGEWILNLMEDYKKEPSGGKLQEKNSKWINDDYVKFIRLGEHYIEKNGEGILAYITNHSYLDNPTFRGMRYKLLQTFDDIYILDLHGNSKKKEVAPDGKTDKNVFDIQQGVAIIIAAKRKTDNKKKSLATIHHHDVWGERQTKYDFLDKNCLKTLKFKELPQVKPYYFFVPKDNTLMSEYQKGFSVQELFPTNSVGIVTARDALTIHEKREDLIHTIERFSSLSVEEARNEFNLGKDARDWKIDLAQKELKETNLNHDNIQKISYRPFDTRWTYYTGKSKGFHCMPRGDVMKHLMDNNAISLNVAKQQKSSDFCHVFIHKGLCESSLVSNRTSEISYSMPLYFYESLDGIDKKRPNLDPKIYAEIQKSVPDVSPESLFDYIYAVLHSPVYRKRYAEFLKSDFPRIPYPKNVKTFHALADKGAELRALHLMESPIFDKPITTYPIDGNHEIKALRFEKGSVWINETQYFGNVPEVAWNFYIGGYQPAQKWLKDRKGRCLTGDDIRHYQRIIIALNETARIMGEIESIDFLPAGE